MSTPLVSAIVLNWNGREDLIECLESLKEVNYPNLEIIVVDNASTDDSVDAVRSKFEVTIVENEQNLGFGGGCNSGLAVASGEYLLFMNNDVTVDDEFLTELIKVAETDPSVGIAGPKVYNYYKKHELCSAGGKIDLARGIMREFGVFEEDSGQYDRTRNVDFVTGCVMLVRKSLIDIIGVFDQQYFIYLDDVDFCIRASKAGFVTAYVPSSKIWHKVSATFGYVSPLSFYYSLRNRIIFEKKYASDVQKFTFVVYFMYESALFFGYCVLRKRQELIRPFFSGLSWHLTGKNKRRVLPHN
ncbi:MAG TPA: glycosyltransferase family 2 protein [Candidatus Acidoferrum sp.]|nr:glycosyltransferase family 2 protein [Candidatus Acidoferrum sp.]